MHAKKLNKKLIEMKKNVSIEQIRTIEKISGKYREIERFGLLYKRKNVKQIKS